MLSQLEQLQELQTRNNPEITTINKQIAELSEQNHVMNGLLSKGILDSALFISQTDELNRKLRALKVAKARILEEQESDGLLEKTEDLVEVLENSTLNEGDAVLFGPAPGPGARVRAVAGAPVASAQAPAREDAGAVMTNAVGR